MAWAGQHAAVGGGRRAGSSRTGWRVVNCDVIIHAQEPKLGPHKPAIRANLARLLRVGETAVNVKAKTGEHVGPIGRARGDLLSCRRADSSVIDGDHGQTDSCVRICDPTGSSY